MDKLDKGKIKGILIDSGYVLIYPTQANNWFISPNMLEMLGITNKDDLKKIKNIIQSAQFVLDKHELVLDENAEIACFEEYYTYILTEYNPDLDIPTLAHKLAVDLTTNPLKYAFYEDSKPIISELKESFKIALVSDAWPSMRMIYDYNDMTKFFDYMVISSELGILKPNPIMYITALENLNLRPEECVFLDDNISNCIGAKKLGITPILVSRNHEDYIRNSKQYKDYINIENLQQLKDLLV